MNNTITSEDLAQVLHETYVRRSQEFGYETHRAEMRQEHAVPNWSEVSDDTKHLMIAVAAEVQCLLFQHHVVEMPAGRVRVGDLISNFGHFDLVVESHFAADGHTISLTSRRTAQGEEASTAYLTSDILRVIPSEVTLEEARQKLVRLQELEHLKCDFQSHLEGKTLMYVDELQTIITQFGHDMMRRGWDVSRRWPELIWTLAPEGSE